MRHRPRPVRRLCALTLVAAAPLTLGAHAPETAEITVQVTGLRSTEGVVRGCMSADPDRFPDCPKTYSAVVPAKDGLTLTFRDVVPGQYAIALLHDENRNGKADRALGMMPKEGFGFSRDAKVRMGPPKFEDAVVTVARGASRQTIRMRYML